MGAWIPKIDKEKEKNHQMQQEMVEMDLAHVDAAFAIHVD